MEIEQGPQKELLISELCNFRSLNQQIGEKNPKPTPNRPESTN